MAGIYLLLYASLSLLIALFMSIAVYKAFPLSCDRRQDKICANYLIAANKLRQIINNFSLFPLESKMAATQQNMQNPLCALILLNFFIYTFFLDGKDVIMLSLVILSYIMFFILAARELFFANFKRDNSFQVLWYSTLIICLPTMASYSILNGKMGDPTIITSILSIASLSLLTNSSTFILCFLIGIFIGMGLYHTQHPLLESPMLMDFTYITIMSISLNLFLFRSREIIARVRSNHAKLMLEIMAHEAKSPSATNYSYAITVLNILAIGEVRPKNNKVSIKFNNETFRDLHEFSQLSVDVAAHGVKTIDALLLNIKKELDNTKFKLTSVSKCVTAAVANYIVTNKRYKNRITIDITDDLQIMGSKKHLKKLIFNLITHSFRYGKSGVKVKIYNEGRNLIIQDDGCSVAPEIAPLIFDHLYSHNPNIAFCKVVMQSFGGDIFCRSQPTRFIITTPNIKPR